MAYVEKPTMTSICLRYADGSAQCLCIWDNQQQSNRWTPSQVSSDDHHAAMQAVLDRPSTEKTSLPQDLVIKTSKNQVQQIEE